eukprot:3311996-Rhodomonas_salina.1
MRDGVAGLKHSPCCRCTATAHRPQHTPPCSPAHSPLPSAPSLPRRAPRSRSLSTLHPGSA